MTYDKLAFSSLPDVISKEQMRIACHISKRTALYLLQSGLIPSKTTGKKTRCYSIQKADVIKFIKACERNPIPFKPPENWYAETTRPHTIRCLPSKMPAKSQFKAYYKNALANYSDVMDVVYIVKFTGYNRRAVGNWCRKGYLKYISKTNKFYIPKCFLIEHLSSDSYNKTNRKTKEHLNAIWEVCKQSHAHGASANLSEDERSEQV